MRRLMTLVFVSILFSCSKNYLPLKEKRQATSPKIETIPHTSAMRLIDVNTLGDLKTVLQSPKRGNDKLMSTTTLRKPLKHPEIEQDSVKVISTEKGVSYVFRMASKNPKSRTFQNLTISFHKSSTYAFITVYNPSDQWLIERKTNPYALFDGYITHYPISFQANFSSSTSIMLRTVTRLDVNEKKISARKMMCNYFTIYSTSAYGCSAGNHMPWDNSCSWNNGGDVPPGESKAGYRTIKRDLEICSYIASNDDANSPGGGSASGNIGDTSPFPPGNYAPCEPGQQCDYIIDDPYAPGLPLANELGLIKQAEIDFLNNAANFYLLGYFSNYLQFDNSNAGRDFIRWAIESLNKGTITKEQFENWFIANNTKEPEYRANDKTINDVNYWRNVNFPAQDLPLYIDFAYYFPKRNTTPIQTISNELGGEIKDFIIAEQARSDNANSCAIRLSMALVKVGITIPEIGDPGGGDRKITLKDKDGKNYFIRADEMDVWMQLTFGTYDGKARFLNLELKEVIVRNTRVNSQHRQLIKPDNYPDKTYKPELGKFLVEGKIIHGQRLGRGIYSFHSEIPEFATGHGDILDQNSLPDGSVYGDSKALKIINIWHF